MNKEVLIAWTKNMKNDIEKSLEGAANSETILKYIETYVQARINIALKFGEVTLEIW